MTEEPQPPAPSTSDENVLDHELDHVVEDHPGFTHAVDNMLIPGFDQKLDAVLSDMDQEAADDKDMLAEFDKRPDAEAAGVSVQQLSDADQTFDDHEVVSVARDCCLILQRARYAEQPDLGAAELSPELEAEFRDAVGRDIASHHHHLLPGFEIDDARIVGASVVDGREVVTVRLSLRGEQMVRDDATGAIVDGSDADEQWQEDWTLTRDPRQAGSGDEDRNLTQTGQWFIAHRGWIVTGIAPVGGSGTSPLFS
ncbi:MAG TPA: TIM44-like domain-containing protein [Chloroflexota bacterium]|nr:TIM44-like domain-containing protein [Chloroflexota bacterium]